MSQEMKDMKLKDWLLLDVWLAFTGFTIWVVYQYGYGEFFTVTLQNGISQQIAIDLIIACVLIMLSVSGHSVSAQQKQIVKLGMSTALSGPAADLGQHMKCGVEVALAVYNQTGKYHCQLIAMDVGYEPMVTVPNMRQLIFKDEVLAILGNVGTPTAVVSLPIVTREKVCFYGQTGFSIFCSCKKKANVFFSMNKLCVFVNKLHFFFFVEKQMFFY